MVTDMFYINDDVYDSAYIDECFSYFDKDPIISQCENKRFTVCLHDTALWIALCLYLKQKGGSVFPLPIGTPLTAARRRAKASKSHYLLFGEQLNDMVESIETINARGEDRTAVLLQMSSGTTGEPKVIARSWSSIDAEINAYLKHFPEANTMTPVVAAPVSHSYGLICGVLVAFQRKVVPLVITNLNPKYILRKLQESHQPILYSSPTLITTVTMLLKSDELIYAIMSSGTLMQRAWFDKVKRKTLHLYQQYGCSEAGCIALAKDILSHDDIGVPLPHHRVSASTEREQPAEIIVTNDIDGKVFTNDLAYFDGDGRLRFVSRIDDMINVSGFNVYPAEVEETVLALPDIEDVVVYKRTHRLGNDQVCLNFVASNPLTAEEIRQWCRQQLSVYQVPMHIKQVGKIDKLPNGKINRKKLAEVV